MAELQAAVAGDPHNIVNQLRLARLQSILGRRGRAEECYSKALEIEQNSMEAGLGMMSDDFEARPANISTCANAAEQLYTSLIPQAARLSSISSSKQEGGRPDGSLPMGKIC
jgi:hypothetical protein